MKDTKITELPELRRIIQLGMLFMIPQMIRMIYLSIWNFMITEIITETAILYIERMGFKIRNNNKEQEMIQTGHLFR